MTDVKNMTERESYIIAQARFMSSFALNSRSQ